MKYKKRKKFRFKKSNFKKQQLGIFALDRSHSVKLNKFLEQRKKRKLRLLEKSILTVKSVILEEKNKIVITDPIKALIEIKTKINQFNVYKVNALIPLSIKLYNYYFRQTKRLLGQRELEPLWFLSLYLEKVNEITTYYTKVIVDKEVLRISLKRFLKLLVADVVNNKITYEILNASASKHTHLVELLLISDDLLRLFYRNFYFWDVAEYASELRSMCADNSIFYLVICCLANTLKWKPFLSFQHSIQTNDTFGRSIYIKEEIKIPELTRYRELVASRKVSPKSYNSKGGIISSGKPVEQKLYHNTYTSNYIFGIFFSFL